MLYRLVPLPFLLFWLNSTLPAQDFQAPKPEVLRTQSDYLNYQDTFIEAVNWLLQHDLDTEGRVPINTFVMAWISGTDLFTIEIKPYLLKLTDANPDLLMVFLGSWAKNVLKKPNPTPDSFIQHKRALESLLQFYSNSQYKKKDLQIERLLKRLKKDNLDAWLLKKL